MTLPVPAWKRERRMEAARSLLQPAPSQSNPPAFKTATWASPSAARVRSRPSNLRADVIASPSFALSQRDVVMPLRTSLQRVAKPTVQSRTTQTMQFEAKTAKADTQKLFAVSTIHLGDYGDVGTMTADTLDFLIRVLKDRRQELLGTNENEVTQAIESLDNEDDMSVGMSASASKVAQLQLDATDNDGADVNELVRSHSYEALVQLEKILEARHNKLMSDGLWDTFQ